MKVSLRGKLHNVREFDPPGEFPPTWLLELIAFLCLLALLCGFLVTAP